MLDPVRDMSFLDSRRNFVTSRTVIPKMDAGFGQPGVLKGLCRNFDAIALAEQRKP